MAIPRRTVREIPARLPDMNTSAETPDVRVSVSTQETITIDAPAPKQRKPRTTKPKSDTLSLTNLPGRIVMRMSEDALVIAQKFIQHFNFIPTADQLEVFIKDLYNYNRKTQEEKAEYVLIIRKNTNEMRITHAISTPKEDLIEDTLIETLARLPLVRSTIAFNASYDDTKKRLMELTKSTILPCSSVDIDINGSITLRQRLVNSNTQQLLGTSFSEFSTLPHTASAYTVLKNVQSQSLLLINNNFLFSARGVIGVSLETDSIVRISFNDIGNNDKFKVIGNISNFDDQKLSVTTRSETKLSKVYLREQIRTRYFMPRPSRGNHQNIVVDSYLPYQLYQDNTTSYDRNYSIGRGSSIERHYAVSRLTADILKAIPIPIDTLCKTVGFTQKQIKDLLTKVKSKQIYPVFVGAGGTNMNTLYWLNELCAYVNVMDIFPRGMCVYEPEILEFSNVLRFPMPLSMYTNINFGIGSTPYKTWIGDNITNNLSNSRNIQRQYVTEQVIQGFCNSDGKLNKGIVFYGAPDINSRKLLAPYGNFIAATHANNNCSIWLNPIQNSDIQVESYGLIQLNTFFMNQFRMAIEFLNILASGLDLTASDTRLFSYSFNGIPENTIDRKLYWQIEQNMEMTPEI